MKRLIAWTWLLAALAAAAPAGAEMLVEQWGGEGNFAHPAAMMIADDGKVVFDLSALAEGAAIRRARLFAFRAPMAKNAEDALGDAEIVVEGTGKPLELVGPWYDCFDVPPAAVKGKRSLILLVKAFPGWIKEKTFLELAYQGKAAGPNAPVVKSVQAIHRAGQTFITFSEVEKLLPDAPATWGTVKAALEKSQQERSVRYRVYRADKPITAASFPEAALLGEVGPLSGYNVNGRSPDQAFAIMRKRMLEDPNYAKDVSRNWYGIPASAYDETVIDRFRIPGGKEPLANGMGLYVHHPAKAGESHYAVTIIANGRENTATFQAGANVTGPVEETVGAGEPVLQRKMDLKVLFDYPGSRSQYVQWTAPPLSNLPNQYYNWSVFVPNGLRIEDRPFPLELFFSGDGMYRRPRWPTRLDTIMLSPHDAPLVTWYYGYPDSQGTLRGLKGATIHPYTWRRMLAMLNWMQTKFDVQFGLAQPCIDRARVTCSGDRGYAATAALHFGTRHPEVFSLVYSCKGMPDPSALPLTIRGGDNRSRPTPAGELERLIGKREWNLKTDSGQNVWDFFNLTAEVTAKPEVLRPMLCHGGRGGWDWKPIGEFFQALADARQPVMSRGEWGEVDPPALKNPGQGRYGLNVRGDRPIMVFARCSSDYQGGRNGDGGSTNMGVWWDESSVVDEPGKFEVVLTGHATVDLTPRRLKNFAVKPAEQVDFKTEGARQGDRSADRTGQVAADGNGLVTVPQVPVTNRTKVIITRSTP